jgi:hypothetical protein
MWGDPHFVTLDGKGYTFNGLGEYVMLDARQGFFQLQARTTRAKGDGTATVFCAAVAKERNTSTVQINLGKEGKFRLSQSKVLVNWLIVIIFIYSKENKKRRFHYSFRSSLCQYFM